MFIAIISSRYPQLVPGAYGHGHAYGCGLRRLTIFGGSSKITSEATHLGYVYMPHITGLCDLVIAHFPLRVQVPNLNP